MDIIKIKKGVREENNKIPRSVIIMDDAQKRNKFNKIEKILKQNATGLNKFTGQSL